MQIAEQERIASPTFVLAWVVSFLQFLAFYALVTTMAVYAVRQFAASDAGAGLASSAFVIGATLSRVVTGHVVDRFGKRRVLVVALVAVALSCTLYLVASSLPALVAVRMLHGASYAFASTAVMALAQAAIPDGRRAEATGHLALGTTLATAIGPALGLFLAALMMRSPVRGAGFFRTVVFLPQVVALTVVAVVWRQIYAPEGPLNDALRAIGLDGLARGWLGDPDWVLVAIGLVGAWVGTGLCMVLFLAGLSKVGRELYEAADMDGASPVQQFFNVTLPGLRPVLIFVVTITLLASANLFGQSYIITQGQPGRETRSAIMQIAEEGLARFNMGSSAAMSTILTLCLLLISLAMLSLTRERDAK